MGKLKIILILSVAMSKFLQMDYLLNRFGISFKSENFLKSSTVLTEKILEIKKHHFVVSDHSLNTKGGAA